jgi:hypothetical protein
MIELYNIVNHKTNVKGYWKDNNKIYKDYIEVKKYNSIGNHFLKLKNELFKDKKQIAIFYIDYNLSINGIAKIENNSRITYIKNNAIEVKVKLSCKYIQSLINKYGGLTIFKNKDNYIISVWY